MTFQGRRNKLGKKIDRKVSRGGRHLKRFHKNGLKKLLINEWQKVAHGKVRQKVRPY